ncbi:MAG: hypothetical protein A4E55_01336 [Pelotomaculum sp. PtaU1.Bin035]|nr:MAG: hypothetical protein A4E55_01336 [Pelotomaculum sp. PtaU1.Bin035]
MQVKSTYWHSPGFTVRRELISETFNITIFEGWLCKVSFIFDYSG